MKTHSGTQTFEIFDPEEQCSLVAWTICTPARQKNTLGPRDQIMISHWLGTASAANKQKCVKVCPPTCQFWLVVGQHCMTTKKKTCPTQECQPILLWSSLCPTLQLASPISLSLSLSLSHFPPLICESQEQERNTSFPFSFPSTRRLIFVCLPLNINQQEPRRLQNRYFAAVQQPNDRFFSPHCIYIFHGFVQYYLGT